MVVHHYCRWIQLHTHLIRQVLELLNDRYEVDTKHVDYRYDVSIVFS
jgi:hypothetical protein